MLRRRAIAPRLSGPFRDMPPIVRLGGALVLVTFLCALLAPSLGAQRLGPEPRARRSAFVADTNDANALYEWGMRTIERDPASAADAFYWAARVDPAFAEPLYGRRAAILLGDPVVVREMITLGRKRPSAQLVQLDSLQLRALSLNPFLFRRFDRLLLVAFVKENVVRRPGGDQLDATQLTYEIQQLINGTDDYELAAWMAYADGEQRRALALYSAAMKRSKFKAPLHIERARIFGMASLADSAIAEFRRALSEMNDQENKDLVVLYNSKAVLEHSIGALLEEKGDVAGAREAYGRALQEDLAFYPSHVRLGLIANAHGDTAAALSELETAAQVAGHEPWVRYSYGFALASAGRLDAAYEQLIKAAELEPLYASPYPILGKIWESRGDAPKAAAAYRDFLARASTNDPQRALVERALENLKPYLPGGG